MNSTYKGPVQWIGGINDDQTSRRSMLSILGDTVKVSTYNPTKGRFEEMDTLTNATVEELRDGRIEATGTSAQLIGEGGVKVGEARITVRIEPRGCQTC